MTEKQIYTKFERARIIGARALQISANAPILIKMDKEELEQINFDPIRIAEMEFDAEILPITVHRPLPKRTEKKEPEITEIVEEETAEEGKKEEVAEEKEKVEEVKEVVKVIEPEPEDEEEEVADEKEEVVEEEDVAETF